MTKRDLVVRISEETDLVQQKVLEVVQKTLDYIAEAVSKGTKVELRNFGVFKIIVEVICPVIKTLPHVGHFSSHSTASRHF